ncbi:MAG TPA: hypothetical protein VME92_20560, partial [Acetobacteraceae bacterium]|nr:hypothetical protein [Acetobacteraceae bacterium]
MAILRLGLVLLLILALPGARARAADPATPAGLYDRPTLVIDPGMHTAMINRASADAAGRWAVTGSDDKTVRIWSPSDGAPVRTIRLPAGPGSVGMVYAVAMSPDGSLVAAGGFTAPSGQPQQIYLFDRASGKLVHRIGGLPNVVLHLAFSPDGSLLAAALGAANGIRIYA